MGKGLVLCGAAVLFWALYAVYARYAASVWAVDPLVFGSLATLAAGLALRALAGRGPLGLSALRDPHTWAYGLLDVLAITLVVAACLFATATELVLLLRVDVIYGLLLARLVFGRRIRTADVAGAVAIVAGCALTAAQMAPGDAAWAIVLIALGSLARAAATIIAERHPTSGAADSVRDRCRITGTIMLVSALVYLSIVGAGALAGSALDPAHPALAVLPDGAGFHDPATLLAAAGLGLLIYAPATYFYFRASRVAGAETFLMTLVYQPILTIGLERGLSAVTPLPSQPVETALLAAILCVVGGSTVMLAARYLRRPAAARSPVATG